MSKIGNVMRAQFAIIPREIGYFEKKYGHLDIFKPYVPPKRKKNIFSNKYTRKK